MKRRALAYVTDCEDRRFDTYLNRGQLPFRPAPLPLDVDIEDPTGPRARRWADYSVRDAFLLRLMLDFVDVGGVDVESGLYTARNARIEAAAEAAGGADIYVAHLQERPVEVEGDDIRGQQHFAGRLVDLPEWLAARTDPDSVQRITIVNASAASRFVLARAAEFDLFPEHDTRPAWEMGAVY
jgi:hypothetical protein